MMNKLGLLGVLCLVGAGATFFCLGTKTTKLPDWYTQRTGLERRTQFKHTMASSALTQAEIDDAEEIQIMAARLEQKVATAVAGNQASPQRTETVALNAREFNQFVVSSVPKTPKLATFWASVKAINTNIQDGQINSGIVINTAELPLAQLPPTQQSTVEDLLRTFPFLQDREIYVGIKGQPRFEQGRLILGEQTQITLGELTLPLSTLASRLGRSEATWAHTLNLQVGQLSIHEIEFVDQFAILRGFVP